MSEARLPSMPLPWHEPSVRYLNSAWEQARWPHALLIHGAEGVGKRSLVRWIAQSVLCDRVNTQLEACGRCASCALFVANTHPDLLSISPEEDKQQISAEQIREACAALAMTSYRSGYKVAIVEPAHQMTLAAANSLLKTLEEPTPRTLLILLSSRPSSLLATIRSRCQQLGIRAPAESDALSWLKTTGGAQVTADILKFAQGAPLRALALAQGNFSTLVGEVDAAIDALLTGRADVTQIAKQWVDDSLTDRLVCVDRWLEQRIRTAVGQTDDLVTGTLLPSGAPALNISRMFVCLDRVRELKAVLVRTALQRELAVEALLLAIQETFTTRPRR